MFKVIGFGNSNCCLQPVNASGVVTNEFETLEKAKKAAAALITGPNFKSYFTSGYDIFILDMESGKVVSRATTEIKSLEWKNAT